jgi:transcriptional regulator with XRE-family HTH domain
MVVLMLKAKRHLNTLFYFGSNKDMNTQTKDKSMLIARGRRLKRLRALVGLSRDELAARAKVSRASMSYWENATYSGLSHKAAEKLIPVIKAEGVHCSVEWLLLGLAQDPYRIPESAQHPIPASHGDVELSAIQQEIALFTSLHPNAVVMQVPHNGMAPFLLQGDYVGGLIQPIDTMQEIEPKDNYIVRFEHTLQARRVKHNPQAGLYDLSYISSVEDTNDLFEKRGVQLESIAKIIRVWR